MCATALLSAGPAHAGVLDATCTGTNTTNYSPGLANTPRTVTVQGTITMTCLRVVGLPLHGTITGGGTGTLNCALLQTPSSGSSTIAWTMLGAPHATSTYTYTSTVSPGASGTTVLILTGTITSGLFQGDTLVMTTVYANLDLLACSTPSGLTSRSGPVVAEITGL
jgi:hypothetical protein